MIRAEDTDIRVLLTTPGIKEEEGGYPKIQQAGM